MKVLPVSLCFAVGLLWNFAFSAEKQGTSPPNIVFIFSDDHAYQAISAYGDPRKLIETPNIDRLAKEGMLFERCLVPNSICGPSRATVLTGKYSHLNGFPNNSNSRFDGAQETFPKQLQKAGYKTALIGKWHLGSDPTGFDHWQILPGQGMYYHPPMIRNGESIEEKGYVTDIITDRSLEWLDQQDKTKPFLLMIQHKAPHREWSPAVRHLNHDQGRKYAEPSTLMEDFKERSLAIQDQDMTLERTFNDRDAKLLPPQRLTEEERKEWDAYYGPKNEAFLKSNLQGEELVRWRYQRYMHDYLGTIQAVDESVGRVLKYLDEQGLSENTLVVYASDQGFYLGEHGWFDKRWIFEESIRTPFLVRWPAVIKGGSEAKQIVSTVDFAQTFLDVAKAEPLQVAQGASLLPIFKGQTPSEWRKSFYYHYYEFPVPHRVRPHYGVVTDRYKLIHFYAPDVNYWELYDREKDPHELRSVYGQSEYLEVQKELGVELAKLRQELKAPETDPPGYQGNVQMGKKRQVRQAMALSLNLSKNLEAESKSLQKAFGVGKNFTVTSKGSLKMAHHEGEDATYFDKASWYQVPNDKQLNPSGEAWSVRARVRAEKGAGIVLARGGEALGYALLVNAEGKPEFHLNLEGSPKVVRGSRSILGKWTTLDAILSKDRKLKLYVDGALEAEVAANFLTREPSDSMQIGNDVGSRVVDESIASAFEGWITFVELFDGDRSGDVKIKTSQIKPSDAKLPNVVIINTDDLGYGDLGVYGNKKNRTPHLDQLAKEGIKFERFYVAQPVCSASRAALLTGCYPSRVGIQGALGPKSNTGLHLDEVTLAEIFKQKAYATAAIGKWHLGDHPSLLPLNQGFDYYYGLPYSNDMWPLHPQQNKRRQGFPSLPLIENRRVIDAEVTAEDQTQLTKNYTEKSLEFIRKSKEEGKPFFLYLAHSMPHVPLFVSEQHQDKSPHGIYADVIEEIDSGLGRIVQLLEELGETENTLVIFTSDNGPWLNYGAHAGETGGLREGKGTVWEGGVRVPLIAKWPKKIPAGTNMKEPAMTIDLLPTLASWIGAELPKHRIDGKNISTLLKSESEALNSERVYGFYYLNNQLQAVMQGEWKLYLPHRYRSIEGVETRQDGFPVNYKQVKLEAPELYNVVSDTSEKVNVAAKYPEKVKFLLAQAEVFRQDLGDSLTQSPGAGQRLPAKVEKVKDVLDREK